MADLPGVILIGDSIRMGYQAAAAGTLSGTAEVWGPEQNGGNSRNLLAHLDEWVFGREAAVVHINCGLHDLRKEFGAGEQAVPPEEYGRNVRRILERLKGEFRGRVVWAATTPVDEELHHRNKGFDRFEADVELYNRIASEIASELEIPIDDLFSVVVRAGKERLLQQDGVHFTREGYELLGRNVADFVRPFLEEK